MYIIPPVQLFHFHKNGQSYYDALWKPTPFLLASKSLAGFLRSFQRYCYDSQCPPSCRRGGSIGASMLAYKSSAYHPKTERHGGGEHPETKLCLKQTRRGSPTRQYSSGTTQNAFRSRGSTLYCFCKLLFEVGIGKLVRRSALRAEGWTALACGGSIVMVVLFHYVVAQERPRFLVADLFLCSRCFVDSASLRTICISPTAVGTNASCDALGRLESYRAGRVAANG